MCINIACIMISEIPTSLLISLLENSFPVWIPSSANGRSLEMSEEQLTRYEKKFSFSFKADCFELSAKKILHLVYLIKKYAY